MSKIRSALVVLAVGTVAAASSACQEKPGFDSPGGVLMLAQSALAADQFDAFAKTLIGDALIQYGDPLKTGDHRNYDELRRRTILHPDASAREAEYVETTRQFGMDVRRYRIAILKPAREAQEEKLAELRVDCERRFIRPVHTPPRNYCRISRIDLR